MSRGLHGGSGDFNNTDKTCAVALQPTLLHRFGGFARVRHEIIYIVEVRKSRVIEFH